MGHTKVWGLIACLAVCASMVHARGDPQSDTNRTKLLEAIIKVESNGKNIIGDGGSAVGILQIHKIMVDDVNRILGKQEFTYQDRSDPAKSKRMFHIYTEHYSSGCSDEVIARRWNGGPKGDRKSATASYWAKVQQHI